MNTVPEYWTIVSTALITLGAAYFAYWLTGKPRLIAFSPNSTGFELKPQKEGDQPLILRAGQVVVQNSGRKSATRIQLVSQPGSPTGYSLLPNVAHKVREGSRGEWILEMDYLGPGETITLQILNGPNIDTVRSYEGPAKIVPVVHQRVFPKWFNFSAALCIIIGLVTIVYAICRALFWIILL